MPLATAYRSFEREPIAAASLGQVRPSDLPCVAHRRMGDGCYLSCTFCGSTGLCTSVRGAQQGWNPRGSDWVCVHGQVHRAVLHSGEQVVVKVQRPGLQKLFDIDLKPLGRLAQQLDAQEEGRDLTGIYTEYASILRKEIDYISEGRNANRCPCIPTDCAVVENLLWTAAGLPTRLHCTDAPHDRTPFVLDCSAYEQVTKDRTK